jgi:hypothetical protein
MASHGGSGRPPAVSTVTENITSDMSASATIISEEAGHILPRMAFVVCDLALYWL